MESRDNVILFGRPGSGIIQNKSWLVRSDMAHAQCVIFPKARRWDNAQFYHSITQEIRMITQRFWMKLILMVCTLLVFIQCATSSGKTIYAMCIGFRSLMNCISFPWIYLTANYTDSSNPLKLEMCRINLTIDSHWYNDI